MIQRSWNANSFLWRTTFSSSAREFISERCLFVFVFCDGVETKNGQYWTKRPIRNSARQQNCSKPHFLTYSTVGYDVSGFSGSQKSQIKVFPDSLTFDKLANPSLFACRRHRQGPENRVEIHNTQSLILVYRPYFLCFQHLLYWTRGSIS